MNNVTQSKSDYFTVIKEIFTWLQQFDSYINTYPTPTKPRAIPCWGRIYNSSEDLYKKVDILQSQICLSTIAWVTATLLSGSVILSPMPAHNGDHPHLFSDKLSHMHSTNRMKLYPRTTTGLVLSRIACSFSTICKH